MLAENIWAEEHGIPTRDALARDLLECPQRIAEAETSLHIAKLAVVSAKDNLAADEIHLLLTTYANGETRINGKNERERQAQLLMWTESAREALREAEAGLLCAERAYNLAVNQFRARRSVAALIAGEE